MSSKLINELEVISIASRVFLVHTQFYPGDRYSLEIPKGFVPNERGIEKKKEIINFEFTSFRKEDEVEIEYATINDGHE